MTIAMLLVAVGSVRAQRQMERLDRGLVAINQGTDAGVFLSWRLLGTDPQGRMSVAWQNVAYNQPPYPSFFSGMACESGNSNASTNRNSHSLLPAINFLTCDTLGTPAITSSTFP